MEQLEKVCKGLECCVLRDPDDHRRCGECPYNPHAISNEPCANGLKFNALALINAQQERIKALEAVQTVRVMTLEELDAIYQIRERHTWPFNTPPYLWMTVNPDVRLTSGFWACWRDIMYSLENASPFYVRESYGKVWKIWTAEPTDEQMEAVKWDE